MRTVRKRNGNHRTNESETEETCIENKASNQKTMGNDSEANRESSHKATSVESEFLGPNRKLARNGWEIKRNSESKGCQGPTPKVKVAKDPKEAHGTQKKYHLFKPRGSGGRRP